MTRNRYPFVVAVVVALAVAAGAPALRWAALDGFIDDAGSLVRHRVGAGSPRSASVAVLAVDAESLATRDLRGMPRLLFGPVWADLTTSLMRAGAKAVVFDFIFALSFDDWLRRQKLGPGGIDGPFLEAIQDHARRVVLARSGTTLPALPYRLALDSDAHAERLGLAEIVSDADGVARELPAHFRGTDGAPLPSLHEAAIQAGSGQARPASGETVRMRIDGPLETVIPTIGLGAWRRCLAAVPDGGELARLVAGRIVFVGSTVPEEDRRSAGDRLILATLPSPAAGAIASTAPCATGDRQPSAPSTGTVPAVYLHAAAAAARLDGSEMRAAGPLATRVSAGATALAAGAMVAAWPLQAAVLGVGVLALLVLAGSVLVPLALVHLAVSPVLSGLLVASAAVLAVRFLVVERRERLIRTAFGRYLSPAIVADLAAQETLPALGGETRRVTVLFCDIAGYSRRVEGLSPAQAIGLVNQCLSTVVRAVDAQAGYVDKFIGDAVMALWNAPAAQDDHARRAVAAALAAIDALASEQAGSADPVRLRIGIETGEASVGNMGTEGRLAYTAIGDTVNVAARLEALCKTYGVPVLVGPGLAGEPHGPALLALDTVVLAGRSQDTVISTPLACLPEAEAAAFAEAERLLGAGDVVAAREAFGRIAAGGTILAVAAKLRAGRIEAASPLSGPPFTPGSGLTNSR